jgi:hypothetical protein
LTLAAVTTATRHPQPVQDPEAEGIEHPSLGPLGQPTPAGRRGAAAKLSGGQQPHGVEVRAMYTIGAKRRLRSG